MKILIVQNKKGIGDLIIFLPFIEALAKKFETQVYLLVKENSKALDIVEDNKYIKEIIVLDRDNQALIQSTQLGADILATYRTGGITGNTAINRLDNLYQGGRGPLSKADYDYFKQDIQGETATDSNNLSEEVSIEDESQS